MTLHLPHAHRDVTWTASIVSSEVSAEDEDKCKETQHDFSDVNNVDFIGESVTSDRPMLKPQASAYARNGPVVGISEIVHQVASEVELLDEHQTEPKSPTS